MIDLRRVVSRQVYGTGPVKIQCLNPLHRDDAASLAVYADNLHCFGCGWHRNDLDECLSLLGGTIEAASSEVVTTDRPAIAATLAQAKLYNRLLHLCPQYADWYLGRGLAWETIDEACLGYDGFRFTIPVFDINGNLLTIRYRKDDSITPNDYWQEDGYLFAPTHAEVEARQRKRYTNPKYLGTRGSNDVYLYGAQWLRDTSSVVVCEGELDALLLHQHALPAVSTTNGAGRVFSCLDMLPDLWKQTTVLYVATDQDKAGNEAAAKVIRKAHEMGLEAYRSRWLLGKDITEFMREGGTWDAVIQEDGRKWLTRYT